MGADVAMGRELREAVRSGVPFDRKPPAAVKTSKDIWPPEVLTISPIAD